MRTVLERREGEITEKKSRFIGIVFPVSTYAEAQERLDEVRKQYRDARHYCFAMRLEKGDDGMLFERSGDDGEPQGTAGRPMLSVLRGEELTDVLLIVVRYFGGTLLGTGGLVRAYTDASRLCMDICHRDHLVIEKKDGAVYRVSVDYTLSGKVQYILAEAEVPVLHTEYGERVDMEVILTAENCERICGKVTDETAGAVNAIRIRDVSFYFRDGKLYAE